MKPGPRRVFYTVSARSGESFKNFVARQDNVHRRVVQHGIKLPEEVQGWFLLKKLHLDGSASGSLQKEAVTKALRSIFPNGKGQNTNKKASDVFEVDGGSDAGEGARLDGDLLEEQNAAEGVQDVMEAVAEAIQGESEYEDEDALEVFESDREIKRRVQEKKVSRGFKPGPPSNRAGNGQ